VQFELADGRRTEPLAEQQVANAAVGQLVVRQQVLAQQLAAGIDPGAMSSLASSRRSPFASGFFPGVSGGAVGYQPVIITLPEGTNLSANAATGTIAGVMVCCDSQQTSRFAKYAKCITQNGSGGTIQDTGNFMPGNTNPLCHTVIMEDDPDGNTWSASTVNDFRMGVEAS